MNDTQCFCGSKLSFDKCCGLYHRNHNAPTALALMKSRYSAFCHADIDYIAHTQRGKAAKSFNAKDTQEFARSVEWLGLTIVQSYADKNNPNQAYVEFIAHFLENGTLADIHELSIFLYDENLQQWFYVDGMPPKHKRQIAKNSPCPCHSNKKFKNCHGKR